MMSQKGHLDAMNAPSRDQDDIAAIWFCFVTVFSGLTKGHSPLAESGKRLNIAAQEGLCINICSSAKVTNIS